MAVSITQLFRELSLRYSAFSYSTWCSVSKLVFHRPNRSSRYVCEDPQTDPNLEFILQHWWSWLLLSSFCNVPSRGEFRSRPPRCVINPLVHYCNIHPRFHAIENKSAWNTKRLADRGRKYICTTITMLLFCVKQSFTLLSNKVVR